MKKIIIACAAAIVIAGVSIFFIFGGLEGKKSSQRDEFAENNFETNQFATQNTNEFSHEFEYLPIAPTALGAISIEVMSFSERGISTSTEFLISSETQKLTAEHLKKTLSAKNGEEFSLEEKNENTFVLSLANEPENNTILNFIYEPEGFSATSFAFQTEDIFRVTATTPRHETYNIPTNTGIEINFSEKLDGGLDAFENAFSIDPHVDGKFFLRDETYIFSPTESLTPGTRYTVMISQKLSGETGAMAQNFIFSFDTNWSGEVYNNAPFFSVSGDAYETFLPWDEIFIALDFSYEFFEKKFSVKIFDLHNAENFLNFSEKNPRTFLEEFEIEAWVFEDRWQNRYYLMLEKSLPEGYYVAEINLLGTDNSARKFIQVSPISVYSAAIDGETVFWINDAASGEPAANAQIIADGTTAFTNAEGVAIVKTNENNRAEIIIRYVDYLPFAYTSPIFGEKKLHAYERFLSYIYTDRNVYRPDDTIDVFGVVKPLHGKSFSDGDFFSLRIGNIFSVPIILDEYNSFAVSVPVSNMMSGAGVDFFVNDEYLMGAYVFFADYTNLSYVISGETDKIVYQPNENAHVKISVTNFAGNPVSGVALNNRWDEKIPRIQTNSEGIASGILSVDKFEEQISWHPWWNNFSFATSGDSQISQSINFPHIIMPRDIMLETELSGSEIKIKTHRIDEKKLEKNNSRRWSELNSENFRGESVDINFELHVTQHITTRTIRSEQYDHINKRTVTTYDHNTTSAPYKIFHGRTENGEAVLYDLPVSNDPLIRFSMEVHYRDGKNRPTLTHVWHRWRYESEFESSVKNFVFAIEKNNLKIGETTKISIVEEKNFNWYWEGETNSDATPPNDGKMLAILIRDGVISATTGNPSGVSVTFSEAGISNTLVHGAYFDGKYIFPVQYGRQLTYDHSEREIDVDLSFEKEIFAPGEEVFAKIKTAPHAQILISVVDEAAIRAGYGEHKPNFRSRFYHSSYIWKRVHQFSSHRQHEMGGNGAEGGGGDDGDSLSFRDNFIDNPVFETVRADENGNASVIFTLPDRITSWRVTAIALTQNGSCGDASENIFSSIDFYVDLLHTNEYIVGDDIAAVARAYGADSVDFNFSVSQNEKIIFTNEIKNSAGREIFNAGKLPVGDYTMRVYATAGNNRDGVEFPFSVTASALIISNNISGDISDFNPNDLKKRPLPVQITFTNAKIRPLMRLMSRDADSNSFRTDQIAAAAFVNYFFTGENDAENVKNKIHAGNGGIPELVYSDTTSFDEFAYAARFAASFPEYVDREKIIRYVNENFDYRGIYEAHRLALAAVGEPVLLQLREAAENFDTNNLSGNNLLAALYLAAAFAAIGDDVGARDFMARIEIPENIPDERQRETAHTLLFFINTSLNPELAWEYVRRENENKFISDVPERINFVRRAKLLGENISEFEFFLDGEKQIVRLENFQRKHLHLSSEQFLALNPRPISGETNFNLHYFGYDSSNWNPNRNTIKISRTITPDDDLYLVELTVTLPPVPCCGSFVIYDRLPSNMRYVPLRRKTDVGAPFFSVQNRQRQLMEINFFVSHNHARTVTLANHTVTLTYHAMKLFDAEMSDGVSYVKNRFADNPIWGSTNSTQ